MRQQESMPVLSNAEVAKILLSLAQLLSLQKENPFKVKAYRRAARAIVALSASVEELVRTASDLTTIAGIGKGISGTIREIVLKGGSLEQLENLRMNVGPTAAALSEYPLLDPTRVERIYKKLNISTVAELKDRLERGDIGKQFGAYLERHIRQGLTPTAEILLYDAHRVVPTIEEFLRSKCRAERAEPAGDYRRRVDVIRELSFLVQTDDFQNLVKVFQRFGGKTALLRADETTAGFQLPSGINVHISNTTARLWGLALLILTGSETHLAKLLESGYDLAVLIGGRTSCPTEDVVYQKLGLRSIPAELREGYDEIERAAAGSLPDLLSEADLRGELHAHTTSSDGVHTIEQMAIAARQKGYEYLGITDHSQRLTIARGVSQADLWSQIRYIEKLNEGRESGIRILKSAEVDILADGSLDYPDSVLKELDYTVCSIHSKFGLSKIVQTERVMRAMDNRYFNILGHATGRRLLKRPGYELDLERLIEHARNNGCFFEINSSPERLDLSTTNARLACQAGVKIAINTDAHSTREFDFITCGLEQGRRAGLTKSDVLNCLPWTTLRSLLRR
jgi:DNA polymerase (family X)